MRERLAFLHLPKSAGTSYRYAISRYYDAADTAPWSFDHWSFGNHDAIPEVPQPILLDDDEDLSGYRYLEGHLALPTIRRGFHPAEVVCILREPRARLLSHYSFWRSWGPELRDQWLPYDVPRAARQSLADYCEDVTAAHQSDNLVARYIVGPHPLIPTDGPIRAGDHAELAALGAQRLDELGFADVLERGDATFDALEAWFGSPLERVRLNETDVDGGPPLVVDELTSPEALRRLHERTAIDDRLWHHVAVRAGLSDRDADVLADVTFASSLARLVDRAAATSAAERAAASDASSVAGDVPIPTPSLPRRVMGLVRRGPRAVAARCRAEVRHRLR